MRLNLRDAGQSRRLLALAKIYNGGKRLEAARIGAVGLQVIRDWVLRFNERGPAGLIDGKATGQPPKLTDDQRQALARLVAAGARHGENIARHLERDDHRRRNADGRWKQGRVPARTTLFLEFLICSRVFRPSSERIQQGVDHPRTTDIGKFHGIELDAWIAIQSRQSKQSRGGGGGLLFTITQRTPLQLTRILAGSFPTMAFLSAMLESEKSTLNIL